MTFTYGGAPSSTRRDRLRIMIGDTEDWGNLSLSDAECDWILTEYSTDIAAAIIACEYLAARCARYADTSNAGGLSVSASQRYHMLNDMAQRYRARRSDDASYKDIFRVPGKDIDFEDTLDEDADVVQPQFRIGMDDIVSPITEEDE